MMRDQYPEFYAPSGDELKRYVTEAVVVPDANILLSLYELSTPQRDEVFTALEAVGERLWLTYQAGYEYQRNRLKVISQQAGSYEAIRSIHGLKTIAEMSETLAGKSLPPDVKASIEALLEGLHEKLQAAAADYASAVSDITAEHVVTVEEGLAGDPVRARLDSLFGTRVGTRPTAEVHETRVKEATARYAKKTPPGYKDVVKPTPEAAAGDYLIWAELLDLAEKVEPDGTPVLFVTLDEKEDWWERSGGNPIGPRPELVREFATRNSHGYYQVTLSAFLTLANEHLATEVPDTTIERTTRLDRDHPAFWERSARIPNRGPEFDAFRSAGEKAFLNFSPEMLRTAVGVNGIDPEALRIAAGINSIDAEMLRIAAGIKVDPSILSTIAGTRDVDIAAVRNAFPGLGPSHLAAIQAALKSGANLDSDMFERTALARRVLDNFSSNDPRGTRAAATADDEDSQNSE